MKTKASTPGGVMSAGTPSTQPTPRKHKLCNNPRLLATYVIEQAGDTLASAAFDLVKAKRSVMDDKWDAAEILVKRAFRKIESPPLEVVLEFLAAARKARAEMLKAMR
jgi:hypothetical protein